MELVWSLSVKRLLFCIAAFVSSREEAVVSSVGEEESHTTQLVCALADIDGVTDNFCKGVATSHGVCVHWGALVSWAKKSPQFSHQIV